MKGTERREKIIESLKASDHEISGAALASMLGVSRQIIVQDIAILRAENFEIASTKFGYRILTGEKFSRVFKVQHSDDQVEEELNLIVDNGGHVEDVFVYHKVYGTVKAELHISSRRDVKAFLQTIKEGKSSLLKNVTSGYHYHTVTADSEEILDDIQEQLNQKGFLARLQDYEPVNFWDGV